MQKKTSSISSARTANGQVILKVDGEIMQTIESNGAFKINQALLTGKHHIELNNISFYIHIDPTRESFPEALR